VWWETIAAVDCLHSW